MIQLGEGKIAVLENGAAHVGAGEIRVAAVDIGQIGTIKMGAFEIRELQIGAAKRSPGQGGLGEVAVLQIGIRQVATQKARALALGQLLQEALMRFQGALERLAIHRTRDRPKSYRWPSHSVSSSNAFCLPAASSAFIRPSGLPEIS